MSTNRLNKIDDEVGRVNGIEVKVTGCKSRKFFTMYYIDPITALRVSRSTKQTNRQDAEWVAAKWEAELRSGRDDYEPPGNHNSRRWQEGRQRGNRRPRNHADKGLIYFIEARGSRTLKIGWTNSRDGLKQRIKSIQTSNPHPLASRMTVTGTRSTEARIHRMCRGVHLGGEWFYLSPTIQEFLGSETKDIGILAATENDALPEDMRAMKNRRTSA